MFLFSIFLAIGCAGNKLATSPETPAVAPVETPVTPVSNVAPQPAVKAKLLKLPIENFSFSPASVEILISDTVRWTNKDSAVHTVRGPDSEPVN